MRTDALASRAHALISTACMLDFPRLGRACQAFERACRSGIGQGAATDDLRQAIAATVAQADELRPAGGTQAGGHDDLAGGIPDRILDPVSVGEPTNAPTLR